MGGRYDEGDIIELEPDFLLMSPKEEPTPFSLTSDLALESCKMMGRIHVNFS